MTAPSRPEADIVHRCTWNTDEPSDELTSLLAGQVDWDDVVRFAGLHAVTPHVHKALERTGSDSVPASTLAELRARSQRILKRNLLLKDELRDICRMLSERNVRFIPYRGPILAEVAYDSLCDRVFKDLDFLVHQEDVHSIKTLLEERGYEPRYQFATTEELTAGQQQAYVRFCRDLPLRNETGVTEVELHWRVVALRFPTRIELDSVWDERDSTTLSGSDVPILSPEDRLVMLTVHGSRHLWVRLGWIMDIARVLRTEPLDWDRVHELIREHNCKRMVYLGLAVTRELYEVSLPAEVERAIEATPGIERLREEVCTRLFEEPFGWGNDKFRYQAQTLDRTRDRVRFWAYRLFSPNRSDIESVSLPPELASLYRVVRVGRLFHHGAKRLHLEYVE